ncbi:MAG: bifunctional phosphoribosyl-AMP cyclohydrolase/phosphoribosyl-ATP diphosphatase HisIE [Wenzhouxiangellaceae bacterium]|jgi:phosphoribosyl-ATP pyrophosphohydrolase/phosphoribosyl-AMP cyclohydrolase|nr:bifunctional phosphoribosyl-AMP cyclohydrolase/phosphoribosyl-ATP diphosphatase HisIE [Wenzhouxiangellaceae bacterium]MBS3747316.1 bifunctional phosphoribosyl-AMP cyclohydrolase/phosphoribosyl-ATP diphosphatase HisIE [Wenzhouxiangellaceae bacterium]MBS3823545.1 bifunctional phosphoribosyl-AMP cyclohydrolase/phosphoribosyl-ATP diphosphatase HisIE [Wenzhouxiangellaceae bacterium]
MVNLDNLDWDKAGGLMPSIVQDARTGRVLMLGYMNPEALEKTQATGHVTFFSRSRQRLWTKGESSGNTLELMGMQVDCDRDTLLVHAVPHGPTCHLGTDTCWGNEGHPPVAFLAELERVIESRVGADPQSSYTAGLLAKGVKRCAQKVGEEGVEVALAATAGDREELVNESADLLYHLLVVLAASDVSLEEICRQLEARHQSR